jgi:splicing factor 3A subunit 1
MQKEAKNYQFDFLRPQHTLFQYFSKLVEQYNKVLIPSKAMRQKLRAEMASQQPILNDVNYRAEWGRYQDRIRKQVQEKEEKVIFIKTSFIFI